MPELLIQGCRVPYEEMGSGQPIIFTSGGRWGREYHRHLAELLSPRYRVIIYDRRNCGNSDVFFGDHDLEVEMWADDLAEIIRRLDLAPAYVGEYAGCRTSPLMTLRYPELVKGMLLGWPSGGPTAAERLSNNQYGKFVELAEQAGMAAVVDAPFAQGGFGNNPSSRDLLLAMDVTRFTSILRRWHTNYLATSDLPIAGMPASEAEVASIQAPTVIVSGDDDVHALATAQLLHRLLPNSEFHGPPVPDEVWRQARGTPNAKIVQAEAAAPIFLDFLQRVESGQWTKPQKKLPT